MSDLSALIAARLCHDFAGSLGAIEGVSELLTGADAKTRAECIDILSTSVARMTARLQLYRAVFADAVPDDAEALRGLLGAQTSDVAVTVHGSAAGARARLALCCGAVAVESLPRGGQVGIHLDQTRIVFEGSRVTLDATAEAVLTGAAPTRSRDAAAALAAQLAAGAGGRLTVVRDGVAVTIALAP